MVSFPQTRELFKIEINLWEDKTIHIADQLVKSVDDIPVFQNSYRYFCRLT